MLQTQCISVTDLRTKTKECLEDLNKEPKYIFINNRPIAVLLDINEYEEHFMRPEIFELGEAEVDANLKFEAAMARKSKRADLINLQ